MIKIIFFSYQTVGEKEEFVWKSQSELDEWIAGRTVSAEGGFSIGLFVIFWNLPPLDEDEIEIPPTIQQILESESQRLNISHWTQIITL